MNDTIAIVGAGHAAGQAVISLRQYGHEGRIVLIGEEPWLPYQRPPLSKQFLSGELDQERLYVKPAQFYRDKDVELHLGTRVESLDLAGRQLRTTSGEHLAWDRLLLTLGSRVRRLGLPGADLEGIHYLRSIDDVRAIQPGFKPGTRLVVVGGGYIGLEVAAIARKAGLEVDVVEMADRLMARVVCPEVSAHYRQLHESAGVRLHLETGVEGFDGDGRVARVLTSAGALPADLVIVGVGILPETELAADAGLDCDDGVCVDEYAVTSHPDVLAAGDCTRHPNALLGRRLRLESVHNALEQARTAAATLCGERRAYAQIPWFWSDQYDTKLQIAGLSEGYERVILRGDPASGSFAACYVHEDDRLLAVDAINTPRDFMQAKKLLADRPRIDPGRLADPAIALPETCRTSD